MAASSSVASASTAANSNNNQWYEIFINNRGVDTKETFARSLYLRLLEQGIRAFLDKPEMQPGYTISSQIENAIKTASIHVAIFSARYAESYWCLHELVLMLESKAPIIPVFYGVTPAELQWTQGEDGIYTQALERLAEKRTHEGNLRYDSNTIQKWRNALSHLADISGFVLDKCNIGDDEELNMLNDVVKILGQRMKKEDLHVAKFPTGLDEKLRDFEDTVLLQRQQRGKPKRLGIWGLGGVGKTTLAKEFFNKKKSDYCIQCFLPDVGDNAAGYTLPSLQRILLKNLTGLEKPIDTVDEGKGLLKKHLQRLTRLDDENAIQMHNHLRDLGRNVAEKSSPRRLWRCTNQVLDDLLHESSKIAVRGIWTGQDDEDDVISLALLKHILRGLQILDTEGERILALRPRTLVEHILRKVKLPRMLRTVELPNLLWLRWINCPFKVFKSIGDNIKKTAAE